MGIPKLVFHDPSIGYARRHRLWGQPRGDSSACIFTLGETLGLVGEGRHETEEKIMFISIIYIAMCVIYKIYESIRGCNIGQNPVRHYQWA